MLGESKYNSICYDVSGCFTKDRLIQMGKKAEFKENQFTLKNENK